MRELMRKIFRSNRFFSNAIIVFCVLYMAVFLQECLLLQGRTSADPAAIAKVAGAFFGGELLMICAAYRFGGKRKSNAKSNDFEEETV